MAPLAIRAENAPIGGAVAQLGERLVRNEEVRGSNPLSSTNLQITDFGPFAAACSYRGKSLGSTRIIGEAINARTF